MSRDTFDAGEVTLTCRSADTKKILASVAVSFCEVARVSGSGSYSLEGVETTPAVDPDPSATEHFGIGIRQLASSWLTVRKMLDRQASVADWIEKAAPIHPFTSEVQAFGDAMRQWALREGIAFDELVDAAAVHFSGDYIRPINIIPDDRLLDALVDDDERCGC